MADRSPGLWLAAAFALLLALLWTGCGDRASQPVTFRYHLVLSPSTLDPARTSDVYSSGVIDRLFDGLMRLDRVRNEPVCELAESYTLSPDRLTYEFHLVPGARFHNGRPIRASDFKFSWERVLASATESPTAWLFELIEGADAFRRGEAKSVKGIEALDASRLRVRLVAPFASFIYHLANPAASVVPREEVLRLGDDFERQPGGSGPYRFVSWEENRVELAAFDDHVRHVPQIERLVYEVVTDRNEALRRYQAGELDLLSTIPAGSLSSLQQTFPSDLHLFPGTDWYGFCFRCDQAPFDDPRVRRAFSLAVDRDALIRELGPLRFTAALGFLPRGIPGHDPATLRHGYDPERARALLAEAGYLGGEGFPKQTYAMGTLVRSARFLVAALSELGIPVEYRSMAFGDRLKARDEGRLSFYRFGWGGEYPDPEPYLRPLFHSRGADNSMAYSNPEVDRLLDDARVVSDAAKRLALYQSAERLILRDAPCAGLYQTMEAILLRLRWKNIPVGYNSNYLEIELARMAKGGS